MWNPNEQEAIFQQRKLDLIRAARLHELQLRADMEQPQFGERLMTLLGDLMINSGERLKARSAPPNFAEVQCR